MADTANMGLTAPVIGTTLSPTWALNINQDLVLIDQHNHTPGSGVPITPAGMSIDSDLPLNQNNLTLVRSVNFTEQPAPLSLPTDLNCIYVAGVDLYYNDGNGNQVRITQSGGVVGSPGSISNLTSPASATYVAGTQTFVWQSDANQAANMDGGSILLRNITPGSFAVTINPPSSLAANYSLTLPQTLPASTKFLTVDNAGNVGDAYDVDNSTIEVSSNIIRVKDGGITLAKMASNSVGTVQLVNASVTNAKLAAPTYTLSSTSGLFSTNSLSSVAVTNLSISLTGIGRPVRIEVIGNDGGTASNLVIYSSSGVAGYVEAEFDFLVDGSIVNGFNIGNNVPSGSFKVFYPPGGMILYVPTAGAHTYSVTARIVTSSGLAAGAARVEVNNCKLLVTEI